MGFDVDMGEDDPVEQDEVLKQPRLSLSNEGSDCMVVSGGDNTNLSIGLTLQASRVQ